MKAVGKSDKTYEYYRNSDPEFKAAIAVIRDKLSRNGAAKDVPDFPEFCEQYLGMKLFPH